MEKKGVLVGTDQVQEWLLPWWWERFQKTNALPVVFADFGMSELALQWCQERGEVLKVDTQDLHVAKKNEVTPSIAREWETSISPFWHQRGAWFKKPFAMLQSPFLQTLWLDLDCEILGPLEPLYSYIHPISKMGIVRVRDPEEVAPWAIYNSGVIAFEKTPLLQKWVQKALFENDRYLSDQDALSALLFEEQLEVGEMPPIYNWLMCKGVPIHAVIVHWTVHWGKEWIRRYGGLDALLRER